MRDIQDEADTRGLTIDAVGIAGYKHRIEFGDGRANEATIATTSVLVPLSASLKGTHMSRMVEIIEARLTRFDPHESASVLNCIEDSLQSSGAMFQTTFDYATTVSAPVSGLKSTQVHTARFTGELGPDGPTLVTSITSHVTSLCPCSQAVSDYGAHNQRSSVTVSVLGTDSGFYPLDITSASEVIREHSSFPVYPLVKRPDERAMTMGAFDRPMFVEDMARDVALDCASRALRYRVEVRNFESIHSHDAVAYIDGSKGQIARSLAHFV